MLCKASTSSSSSSSCARTQDKPGHAAVHRLPQRSGRNSASVMAAAVAGGAASSSSSSAPKQQQQQQQQETQLARRAVLRAGALLPAAAIVAAPLLWGAHPAAAAAAAAAAASSSSSAAAAESPVAPPPPSPYLFKGDEFELQVPSGFRELEDAPDPNAVSRPRSTLDGEAPENPIKARFVSSDGRQVVTVLARQASRVKPTFLQLADITQYGDLKEVADLLLPKGTTVLSATKDIVALPPRDTGTIRGVVESPPETVYRYEVTLANGLRSSVAIAAIKGRVYVMAASAPAQAWAAGAAEPLRACAKSFKLVPNFKPVIY